MGTPSLHVSTLHIQNSTVRAVAGKSLKSGNSSTCRQEVLSDQESFSCQERMTSKELKAKSLLLAHCCDMGLPDIPQSYKCVHADPTQVLS